jgi:succinyl-diaminopimelate desuccinylase
MSELKQRLIRWLDADREENIAFLRDFVRAKSPNPPGDTREAAAHVTKFLERNQLAYRVIAPEPTMPNIVASFEGTAPGRHLVLNGHMDVFPADAAIEGWTQDPWGGAIVDGRIYGRGVSDMKCGTSASILTYRYLHRVRDHLKGKLTLTAVSDEETFGPWGARYLMEHHPEVHGDCCLNGEPSSPLTVRFGEKAPLWLKFTVRTPGAHGAYTNRSASATKIAARLILALEDVTNLVADVPANVKTVLERERVAIDRALGAGASEILQKVTLNIGVIHGGLKVNMIPGTVTFEADLRLPPGLTKQRVMPKIMEILAQFPEANVEEINASEPSLCDPDHEMMGIIQRNVTAFGREKPVPVVSLGGTDARLWRLRGVPAYVYGPFPDTMGRPDENVPIEDYLHILRTHLLSAFDYLTR